ncbi:4'-phosphopantetheinyl transferase family protein [Streptomyces oceani]|uniref:4'-phosphopantetheinyl transferase family protein n=1 Tax=Streptomyces oceani TaxID=1075402 RepID=UPI00147B5D05|nr:4'-phosphopantetheinyl transferase superfamily protein [Streptomyces oceani]
MAYGWELEWLPPCPDETELRGLLGGQLPRYLELTHHRARERYLASRVFFRHIVAVALSAPPESVDIGYMPHGRPYVRGCGELEVSLSHSGPLQVAAVSRVGRIGVDAEAADRPLDGSGWDQSVCTPQERVLLASLPPEHRSAELVRMWTLKEAYSKAMGQGMRYPFERLGFSRSGVPERSLGEDGDWHPLEGWNCATTLLEGARPYRVSWVHQRREAAGTASAGWPAEAVLMALSHGSLRRQARWRAP